MVQLFFLAYQAYVVEANLKQVQEISKHSFAEREIFFICLFTSNAIFQVRKQNTPFIQSVSPTSFSPGPESVIALGGMIFTDRYGTNVAASSNGKEETVNRVYAGPLTCELRKTNDELYVS